MKTATVWLALLAACAGRTAPAEHPGSALAPAPIASAAPSTSALPSVPSASPSAARSVETPPAVPSASQSAREDVETPPAVREHPGRRDCGHPVAPTFEHWRSAIESYVPAVLGGNQRPLGAAGLPFARYINAMHRRIHPLFTDCFLESLDGRPKSHPMNDPHLFTRIEIVLSSDGRLKRMGVVRTSGITAFDIAALDVVERAQPFGPAPSAILSTDGNVYLYWELHRDEVFGCSPVNARPFLLSNAP